MTFLEDINIIEIPVEDMDGSIKHINNYAQVTLDDIYGLIEREYELLGMVIREIGSIERGGFYKEKSTIYDIVNSGNELEIAEFMATYKFLNGFYNKVKKQVENYYTPLLEHFHLNEKELLLDLTSGKYEKANIYMEYNVDTKMKFNFMATRDALSRVFTDGTQTQVKKSIEFLEKDAGFAIARTSLEKVLKKKGFSESQIVDKIGRYVFTEKGSRLKINLPTFGSYDPNERILFQIVDPNFIYFDENSGTSITYIRELLELYIHLEELLNQSSDPAKSYNAKLERILKDTEELTLFDINKMLDYINIAEEEVTKIKFNGLYKDKNGNYADIIGELLAHFHLTDEDVNTFVNSRKKNIVSLPSFVAQLNGEPSMSLNIPTYERVDTKYFVEGKYIK